MEEVNNINNNILRFNIVKSFKGFIVIIIYLLLNVFDNADIFSDFKKKQGVFHLRFTNVLENHFFPIF